MTQIFLPHSPTAPGAFAWGIADLRGEADRAAAGLSGISAVESAGATPIARLRVAEAPFRVGAPNCPTAAQRKTAGQLAPARAAAYDAHNRWRMRA